MKRGERVQANKFHRCKPYEDVGYMLGWLGSFISDLHDIYNVPNLSLALQLKNSPCISSSAIIECATYIKVKVRTPCIRF